MTPLSTLTTLAAVAVTASAFVTTPSSFQLRPLAPAASSAAQAPHVAALAPGPQSRPRRGLPTPLLASATATYEMDDKELRGPLTPLEDTVLVKVGEGKRVTKGGLFLPEQVTERKTRGTVVAVGEGKRHWDTGVQIPITVNVGESVVYGTYDGTSVQYQGADHLLMRDTDLLMAYEGEEINLDTSRMVADRVLLRVKAVPKGSSASSKGILIAESATRSTRPTTGVVVKVGPGRMVPSGVMMPMYCEVGDCVRYKVRHASCPARRRPRRKPREGRQGGWTCRALLLPSGYAWRSWCESVVYPIVAVLRARGSRVQSVKPAPVSSVL